MEFVSISIDTNGIKALVLLNEETKPVIKILYSWQSTVRNMVWVPHSGYQIEIVI